MADCGIPSYPPKSFFHSATQELLLASYVPIKCALFCLSFKALSVPTLPFKVCLYGHDFFHPFIQQINIEGLLLGVCYWTRKAEVMQGKKDLVPGLPGLIFLVRKLENKE